MELQTKPFPNQLRSYVPESAEPEQKQISAVLRLAAIVESSDDAIVSKDLNGTIQSWNAGAEKIFGYTAESMIGKSIMLLIPPERRFEEREIISRIQRVQRVQHYETVRVRRDGSLINVSLTISPIKNSFGKVIGASKIARDITERKRVEAQQQALFDFMGVVSRTTNLIEIYAGALDAAMLCQDAPRETVQVQGENCPLKIVAWRNLSTAFRISMEGYSPWSTKELNHQLILIADAPAGLETKISQAIVSEGIRALAFVPITFERRYLGRIAIYYNIPHPFSRNEMRPAENIAAQVAFAIERQKFISRR